MVTIGRIPCLRRPKCFKLFARRCRFVMLFGISGILLAYEESEPCAMNARYDALHEAASNLIFSRLSISIGLSPTVLASLSGSVKLDRMLAPSRNNVPTLCNIPSMSVLLPVLCMCIIASLLQKIPSEPSTAIV